jgi:hypothetical protein
VSFSRRTDTMRRQAVSTNDEFDSADMIDPTADDPTPGEISDVQHEDYVESYPQATPIGGKAR